MNEETREEYLLITHFGKEYQFIILKFLQPL